MIDWLMKVGLDVLGSNVTYIWLTTKNNYHFFFFVCEIMAVWMVYKLFVYLFIGKTGWNILKIKSTFVIMSNLIIILTLWFIAINLVTIRRNIWVDKIRIFFVLIKIGYKNSSLLLDYKSFQNLSNIYLQQLFYKSKYKLC